MLDYTTERVFRVPVTVELSGHDGRHHKGTFNARFRQIPNDEATAIAKAGGSILERALLELGDELVLRTADGKIIEEEELRQAAALNDSKMATALANAYWAEALEKKG